MIHLRATANGANNRTILAKRPRPLTSALSMILVLGLVAETVVGAELVGRINGTMSVSRTGAATYSIPITVAAGQNGLKPNISLAYSSRANIGLAGVGWSIGGLSQISRCRQTIATDGHFRGVEFNKADRYCLDGQPLIQVGGGNYWRASQEYRSEIHNYEKVVASSTLAGNSNSEGESPEYFIVHLPNGLRYTYGATADSRVEAPNNSNNAIRLWALNEVQDQYGEKIFFEYDENTSTGEFRPSKIYWSGQNMGAAKYRIRFKYQDSPPIENKRFGYKWGSIWTKDSLLESIYYEHETSGSFSQVHKYTLTYQTNTGSTQLSKLDTITECGVNDCLPPTVIDWQLFQSGFSLTASNGPSSAELESAIFVDLNQNGPVSTTDIVMPVNGYWTWYVAQPPDEFENSYGAAIAPVIGNPVAHTLQRFTANLGAIVIQGGDGNWHVRYLGNCSSSGYFCDVDLGMSAQQYPHLAAVDVNGDSLTDLVAVRGSDSKVVIRINSGGGFLVEQITSITLANGGPEFYEDINGFTDFDGDGREDILIRDIAVPPPGCGTCNSATWLTVYQSYWDVENGKIDFRPGIIISGSNVGPLTDVKTPDINGDGLNDFLYKDGLIWKTRLSRGNAQAAPLTTSGFSEVEGIADINRDGRSDVIAPCGVQWCAYLSDGSSYSSGNVIQLGGPNPNEVLRVALQDVTGDGYPDMMMAKNANPTNTWVSFVHDGPKADLVTNVTDGLGNVDTVSFTNKFVAHVGTLDVVDTYINPAGVSNTYLYGSGAFDSTRSRFSGYSSTTVTNSADNTRIATDYATTFPYIGMRTNITRYQADGKKIQEYVPKLAYRTTNAGYGNYYFVHLKTSTGGVGSEPSSTTTEYEVDAAGGANGQEMRTTERHVMYDYNQGAIYQDTTVVTSPAHPSTLTTTVSTEFWSGFPTGTWCLGFPSRVDVKTQDETATEKTHTVQHTYKAECRIETERVGPFGAQTEQRLTTYAYNTDGTLASVAVDQGDPGNSVHDRVTVYDWDVDGYRQVKVTQQIADPDADLTLEQTWDYGLGFIKTRKDARSNTTYWHYDEFGRTVQVDAPGPATTKTLYESCSSSGVSCIGDGAVYRVRTIGPAVDARSDAFFDSFGRQVGRIALLVDGSESRQTSTYDLRGRLKTQEIPHLFVGDSSMKIIYDYDVIGRIRQIDRPISVSEPSGALTKFTYNRQLVTMKDAEQEGSSNSTQYEYDVAGRLVGVTDALSKLSTYSYWPDGPLRNITSEAGGASLSYDSLGNPDIVNDANSGTWDYDYNIFGELVRRTDDKVPANVMDLVYDQAGRLQQRTDRDGGAIEGVTQWTYYASGNGLGFLKDVKITAGAAAGYEQANTYNSLGRLSRTSVKIDSYDHTTDYLYNAAGQLEKMTYPAYPIYGNYFSRPEFSYTYSNGYLEKIIDERAVGDNLIYQVNAQDAQGRATLSAFGTKVEQAITFDPATGLVSHVQTETGTGGLIQDLSYQWDKVGNLTQRQDNDPNNQVTEMFSYDELYRLASIDRGDANTTLTYGPNGTANSSGNIYNKSDVGDYTYGEFGAGPHAVTTIVDGQQTATHYHYDSNGNMDCRDWDSQNLICNTGGDITWYSFNKPKRINDGAYKFAEFTYGPERQRIKQVSSIAAREIRYAGAHFEWEMEGSTTIRARFRSTVFANGRAVYTLQESILDEPCPAPEVSGSQGYFIFRDHLGSVDKMRADGPASDLAYSFDAFGKRRNSIGWGPNDSLLDIDHTTKRGFTGHEHLDNVRLIHMNGRVQDPVIGRMISADPMLGDLKNPQSLNRYSYVNNNPLSYTDPSGYWTIYQNAGRAAMDFDGYIFDLEVAIDNFRSDLKLWAADACSASGCRLDGNFPSVGGIVGAAGGVASASTALAFSDLNRGFTVEANRELEYGEWMASLRTLKPRPTDTSVEDPPYAPLTPSQGGSRADAILNSPTDLYDLGSAFGALRAARQREVWFGGSDRTVIGAILKRLDGRLLVPAYEGLDVFGLNPPSYQIGVLQARGYEIDYGSGLYDAGTPVPASDAAAIAVLAPAGTTSVKHAKINAHIFNSSSAVAGGAPVFVAFPGDNSISVYEMGRDPRKVTLKRDRD